MSDSKEVAWKKTLPKKRMAAGALFFNTNKEILVVVPKYGSTWEIPGGVIEANESPRQACVREIREELGISVEIRKILCVDYRAVSLDHPDESIQFVFFGGTLSNNQIQEIKVGEREILETHWITTEQIKNKISNPALASRILAAVEAYKSKTCLYLES